jgi:hypothetical protein
MPRARPPWRLWARDLEDVAEALRRVVSGKWIEDAEDLTS